uniref:Helicase-associated domain-containing protein n=1 Tax=Haptolina brevifila TaxID=156173 RepID=A0A7S2HDX1_9EUKA|mmetsp:Transcript_53677/g.106812  ORF Transcript_53677/g.106812 Transcript_53677/m.106812 type:complete len:247 (+) Transcript_53677:3-743(+)
MQTPCRAWAVVLTLEVLVPVCMAFALRAGPAGHDLRRCSLTGCAAENSWDSRLEELSDYARQWHNADAPLNTDLGRWCAVQRRLHMEGKLSERRETALAALDFSWESPSQVDNPEERYDWDKMCAHFVEYRAEHGDGQVPKKFQPDPALGGWVAAVRRKGAALGPKRVAALDAIGFEWKSTRQCGSAFMKMFRELRMFRDAHGHTDAPHDTELGRWCAAQRHIHKQGKLSETRAAYLEGIGFEWRA